MPQANIDIKTASVNDAKEILEVQKDAFLGQSKIYNNYQLPPLTQTLESIEEEFTQKTFLKVTINNQIVGSVRFEVNGNYVIIDRVVVSPKHQNKGIGTSLLKEIESRVPNAVAFQLFTGNKSVRNIHLYEKVGYKEIRRETTEQGIELLHMEKRP